jgi:excisionase family DNA binding protein
VLVAWGRGRAVFVGSGEAVGVGLGAAVVEHPANPASSSRVAALLIFISHLSAVANGTALRSVSASLQLSHVSARRIISSCIVLQWRMDEHLSIGEAATLLGVSRNKVVRLIKEGVLPAEDSILDKRRKRIPRSAVLDILKREGRTHK